MEWVGKESRGAGEDSSALVEDDDGRQVFDRRSAEARSRPLVGQGDGLLRDGGRGDIGAGQGFSLG